MNFRLSSVVLTFVFVSFFVGMTGLAHADDTTGVGEELSVERVAPFVSLMGEHLDTVARAEISVEGNREDVDGAPEPTLEGITTFLLEEFEKAQGAPQFVQVTDQAHRTINDNLSLCLRIEKTSEKSELSFGSLTFCQGVGSNVLNKLVLGDNEGNDVLTYNLESFEKDPG